MNRRLSLFAFAVLIATVDQGNVARAGLAQLGTYLISPDSAAPREVTTQYQSASLVVPIAQSASVNAISVDDVNLDASNTGTLQILHATIDLGDYPTQSVGSGLFGGLDVAMSGLRFRIESGTLAVSSSNLLIDDSSSVTLSIFAGTITMNNFTGVLSSLYTDPQIVDFSATPMTFDLSSADPSTSLTGTVNKHTSDMLYLWTPWMILDFDLTLPLLAISNVPLLDVAIHGSVTLSPIPEVPSSILTLTGGTIALIAARSRRCFIGKRSPQSDRLR